MISRLHHLASRLRRSGFLARQQWLWQHVEPVWNAALVRLTARHGLVAVVNGEPIRLLYPYAAKYHKLGCYEPRLAEAFLAQIQVGMTVFDIGAHVGFLTIAAARRVGSTGRVVSFEPAPETAEELQAHIRMNRLQDRVTVHRLAVSDACGTVSFYTLGRSMSASLDQQNVLDATTREPPGLRVQVHQIPAITLDEFCEENSLFPSVLKIDIEGAELKALAGARKVLRSRRPTILCEVHPRLLQDLGGSEHQLFELAREMSYGWKQIDEPNDMGIYHVLLKPVQL